MISLFRDIVVSPLQSDLNLFGSLIMNGLDDAPGYCNLVVGSAVPKPLHAPLPDDFATPCQIPRNAKLRQIKQNRFVDGCRLQAEITTRTYVSIGQYLASARYRIPSPWPVSYSL